MPNLESLIEFYIHWIWQPINIFQGEVAELLPFSLANFYIINGTICALFIFYKAIKYKTLRGNNLYLILSVLILLFQLGAQGATPFGTSIVFYRTELDSKLHVPPIDSLQNAKQWLNSQKYFLANYQSFSDTTQAHWLKKLNLWVDLAYEESGFKKPNQVLRQITKIKDYNGISRLIGLSYGGPAFSDPIISEVAMASQADYPIPFAYRLEAWAHEIVHAKGLGIELETENLTFLALLLSNEPKIMALAHHKFLQKNNIKYEIPLALWLEWEQSRLLFREAKKNQVLIEALKATMQKLNLQNSSEKYGNMKNPDKFNPENKFLKTSLYFFDRLNASHTNKD